MQKGNWIQYEIPNISKYKMIQILLRDATISEITSNITSLSMFKDCNSSTRVFAAKMDLSDNNSAYAYYISDTQIGMYLGINFRQSVLIGWY